MMYNLHTHTHTHTHTPTQQCSWTGQRQNKAPVSHSCWGDAKPHDDTGQPELILELILPSIPQPPATRTQFPIFATPCPRCPLESTTSLDIVQDEDFPKTVEAYPILSTMTLNVKKLHRIQLLTSVACSTYSINGIANNSCAKAAARQVHRTTRKGDNFVFEVYPKALPSISARCDCCLP